MTNQSAHPKAHNDLEQIALLTDIWSALRIHGTLPSSSLNPDLSSIVRLKVCSAIVDESLLPTEPPALVKGVLEEGGKAIISGAPKTYKSFLMISLGLAVATGTEWLGCECEQAPVAYLNLEIGSAQFMRRIFDMASSSGLDKNLIKNNFKVIEVDGYATMHQFVDCLIDNREIEGCKLLIIDPLYKIFSGSENSQEDMAAFFSEIDRVIDALGCTVVVVHHHSKGFQGLRDITERACGSSVLGRDPDTILSVERLNAPGNAMRVEFSFRGFEEKEPADYRFEYPLIVFDKEKRLSHCRVGSANVVSQIANREQRQRTLDEACKKLMKGRSEFKRTELQNELGWKPETIDKYLETSTLFKKCRPGKNICLVQKR